VGKETIVEVYEGREVVILEQEDDDNPIVRESSPETLYDDLKGDAE
jgi:hypothetical protein